MHPGSLRLLWRAGWGPGPRVLALRRSHHSPGLWERRRGDAATCSHQIETTQCTDDDGVNTVEAQLTPACRFFRRSVSIGRHFFCARRASAVRSCPARTMSKCPSTANASSAPLSPLTFTSVNIAGIHHFPLLRADSRGTYRFVCRSQLWAIAAVSSGFGL